MSNSFGVSSINETYSAEGNAIEVDAIEPALLDSVTVEVMPTDRAVDTTAQTNTLNSIVPVVPPMARATPQSAQPARPRTLGMTANPSTDASRGVLAVCPQGEPPKTQPDWYMPGYQRIEQRLCDRQWVTCGNAYPCAGPTPKGGELVETEYGDNVDTNTGTGMDSYYQYYAAPKH